MNLEAKISRYFNRLGSRWLDRPAAFVSSIKFLASLWLLAVLIFVFLYPQDAFVLINRVGIVAVLHFSISEGIFKYLLPRFVSIRKRPYVAYPGDILAIGKNFSDSSFPSSHMASTVAMITVISSIAPAVLIPGIIFSIFMAYARLHNGMHYITDILAGCILGLIYGLISTFIL